MNRWRSVLVVISLAFSFAALGAGCGAATACDRAVDKVQQCGVQDAMLNSNGEECAAIAECEAECILRADCGDIRDAIDGLPNSVTDCIDHCG